jgi:hypothetical protein
MHFKHIYNYNSGKSWFFTTPYAVEIAEKKVLILIQIKRFRVWK